VKKNSSGNPSLQWTVHRQHRIAVMQQ